MQALRASTLGGLTAARLLQFASTAFGLAAIGWHLWRCRGRLRVHGGTDAAARLGPIMRWSVVALLVAVPVLGGAVDTRDDFNAYRYVTEVDYSQPTTVDLGDGASDAPSFMAGTDPAGIDRVLRGEGEIEAGKAAEAGAVERMAVPPSVIPPIRVQELIGRPESRRSR